MHIHEAYLTVVSAPDAAYSVTKNFEWCAIANSYFGTAWSVGIVKECRVGTGYVFNVERADPGMVTTFESFRYGAQVQQEKRLY